MMSWVADLISDDLPEIVVNFPRIFVASDEFFRVAYLSYAIFPDGRIHIMEGKAAQQECYDYIGRKPQAANPKKGKAIRGQDRACRWKMKWPNAASGSKGERDGDQPTKSCPTSSGCTYGIGVGCYCRRCYHHGRAE